LNRGVKKEVEDVFQLVKNQLKNAMLILVFLCGWQLAIQAQTKTMNQQEANKSEVKTVATFKDTASIVGAQTNPGDSLLEQPNRYYTIRNVCKGYRHQYFLYSLGYDTVLLKKEMPLIIAASKNPQLKIKGNILYDLNYRSNVDTPYAQTNVYQHTIQTYLDITWKDNYPFRMYITNRFGNSPLFRNFSDINFAFDPNEFSNKIKRQLLGKLMQAVKLDSLNALKKSLEQKLQEYNALQNWVKNPAQLQRIIEERERLLAKKPDMPLNADQLTGMDNKEKLSNIFKQPNNKFNKQLLVDSLENLPQKDSLNNKLEKFETVYSQKKNKLDSLLSELKKLDSLYQAAKLLQKSGIDQLKKEIEETTTIDGLKDKLQKLHIADSALPKNYKTLFALKSFGIGRSIVDYSELSAKNISVSGLQVEYNPKNYFAFAAGVVDYRFRDYIIRNPQQQKQYLALVRFGKGEKEGNHVFFTYYTGRRQLYNASTNLQANTIPNYNLMGITVEARYNINANNYLIAEIAKSSLPYYSLDSTKGRGLFENVIKMNDRTNEAYAAKLVSFIPLTQTNITASYKHMGANFQSFSLFTTGSAQSAWSVRVDQPFFKRRLTVMASVRENDFVNTFTNAAYQSNTILKSIQATLRIKKLPVVSIGYFPSSQLTKLSNNQFTENLFYTLVGSASHFYKIKKIQANSMLVYTQFYNRSSDSGFVYFNTRNLLFSQSFFMGNTSLQSNFSMAANTYYRLYVLEQNFNTSINKWLSLGAGLKYNQQTVFNKVQWGYSGNAKIKIPVFGDVQLMMDKGFLPGANRQLVENKMGRLTYFKTF
jgi:hypothetical protein